jgi:hypothetical protein
MIGLASHTIPEDYVNVCVHAIYSGYKQHGGMDSQCIFLL